MLRQIEGSRAVAEAVALARPEVICAYPISPQTHIVEALGEVTLLYVNGPVEEEPVVVKLPGIVDVKKGQTLRFSADKTKLHLFDADGQAYRR